MVLLNDLVSMLAIVPSIVDVLILSLNIFICQSEFERILRGRGKSNGKFDSFAIRDRETLT